MDRFFSEHQNNEMKWVEEERRKEKKSKNELLEQILHREEKQRELIQILASEEKERRKARDGYSKKIENRRLKGQQELDAFKSANRLY